MPASATSCARSRRRNGAPVAPDEQRGAVVGSDATARSSGPVVPSATRGDAAVPAASASSTDASGVASPADASTAASRSSALQSARNSPRDLVDERRVQRVDARRRAEAGRRLERVEPRVGEVVDRAHLLDARAVDLLDLAHEQVDRDSTFAQQHRELVDRDVVAALEHVDADDVAVDRTDARGDETERARSVGEPDPHEDVGGRLGGVAHLHDATGADDAECFAAVNDTTRSVDSRR